MVQQLTLADGLALGDLHTYLQRAGRVEDGSVRLIAGGGVLAVYTAIVYPRGILDESPTVLGLRTFALVDTDDFDSVVPMRSLVDRVSRARDALADDTNAGPVSMTRPAEVNTVTWAGISPPRGGWRPVGETVAPTLEAAARAGIDEVAAAIPSGTGEQLVQRVRSEVWGRGLRGVQPRIPRRRPDRRLRDRPVDAAQLAARSCARAAAPLVPQGLTGHHVPSPKP